MTTGEPLTLRFFLQRASERLAAAGFECPRRESRALVEAITGLTIAEQLACPEQPVGKDQFLQLEEGLESRLKHKPLQQIAGAVWFDGLRFQLDGNVLAPRPETEHLVEVAYEYGLGLFEERNEGASGGGALSLLDTFTGTGAVGISLGRRFEARGIPLTVSLADISKEALEIAGLNAGRQLLQGSFQLVLADIWPAEEGRFDLITANPPYVETAALDGLMAEVASYEPRLALDGGEDGLHFYRRLAEEGPSHLSPAGFLLVEVGAGQAGPVSDLFVGKGWRLERVVEDYAGHKRVLSFST